jgi:hypothetical protein
MRDDPTPYPLSTKIGCVGGMLAAAVVMGLLWWLV